MTITEARGLCRKLKVATKKANNAGLFNLAAKYKAARKAIKRKILIAQAEPQYASQVSPATAERTA